MQRNVTVSFVGLFVNVVHPQRHEPTNHPQHTFIAKALMVERRGITGGAGWTHNCRHDKVVACRNCGAKRTRRAVETADAGRWSCRSGVISLCHRTIKSVAPLVLCVTRSHYTRAIPFVTYLYCIIPRILYSINKRKCIFRNIS